MSLFCKVKSYCMKKRVAVITGGNSSEYVISVKSADTIIENIDEEIFAPYRVEIKDKDWKVIVGNASYYIDKNDFSFQIDDQKVTFDCALIMIHGDPGEDGKLQGYLDMLNIPYTSSGVLSSSATFNKHFTKQYLKSYGIRSAEWLLINHITSYSQKEIDDKIGFPCFVKPNNAGSSFGVSRVNNFEQLEDALKKATIEDSDILIEQLIDGTEITCGVLRTVKNAYTFPVTEIVSKTGFFDYEAKYTVGKADEIVPARIQDNIAKKCQKLSLKIYDLFNCRWFARIDYILRGDEMFVLEINTIPGMSKESIVPKMINASDKLLKDLLTEILSDII